jgi:hypothetical protein
MFGRLGTTSPNFGWAFVSIEEEFQACYDVVSAHLPEPSELAQCRISKRPQFVPRLSNVKGKSRVRRAEKKLLRGSGPPVIQKTE